MIGDFCHFRISHFALSDSGARWNSPLNASIAFMAQLCNDSQTSYNENCTLGNNNTTDTRRKSNSPDEDFPVEVIIISYALIFTISVFGNVAVIITLTRVRSMRTVTNVLLLNLSVADLMVAVGCMPATLTGTLMRDFIFGSILCRIFPFIQGKNIASFTTKKRLVKTSNILCGKT